MSQAMLQIEISTKCDCCDAEVTGTWNVPASAFGRRRSPGAEEAVEALAKSAEEEGWLVRGSAALCPECLKDAVAEGTVQLTAPASAVQAIDQLALARAVRKLRRKAGLDERSDI